MKSPDSSNSWIGRFIGDNQRYRLDRSLGGGGMGQVFLATDTRVGKEVALKLLKDKWLASGEMRKRFEREIAICAALQSEHIIEISDCGVTNEGFPFYVMEYLRGQTLRQLMLREKQLSPLLTVNIMSQVCEGLKKAHQGVEIYGDGTNSQELIKVIHRDLKPDNIFLLPRESGEWVKILDFGIAKILKQSSEQTNLTQRFIGTFRYSSPEQIQNYKDIDGRSDIYSLGIILYEMLTALDPFGLNIDGNRVSESSWLHAHGYRPPIPLRSQIGCEHLSPQLEAIVIKCLQKKPKDRFASVEELNQALQETAQATTNTNYSQPRQIIIQPQSQQNQIISGDETVAKPVESKPSNQPRANQASANNNHAAQPIIPDGTSYQPRPNQASANNNRAAQPIIPEGTSYQPRPNQASANNNPTAQPIIPDGTSYQPRPNQASANNNRAAQPITPDGTTYQPRSNQASANNNRAAQPIIPDGTTYQPRPNPASANNNRAAQPIIPDGTTYQPRSNPASANNNRAAQPIASNKNASQRKKSKNSKSKQKNFNIWKIIAINLAITLLFIIVYYLINLNRTNDNPDPQSSVEMENSIFHN
jgi:serine/threonine-protein kinase